MKQLLKKIKEFLLTFKNLRFWSFIRSFDVKEDLRLVVMNRDTFEEKYAFNLNLMNLYVFISSMFVIFFVLFYLLIAYTPVKQLIPGYGDIENNAYVIKLNKKLSDLETRIEAQDNLNKSLKKILMTGESQKTIENDLKRNDNKQEIKSTTNDKKSTSYNYFLLTPLNGKINRKTDMEDGHYGIDIAGFDDNPIRAVASGNVVFADWSTDTGYTIIIQHRNGLLSVYEHNSSLLKETGDFVQQGESIAILGNTGSLSSGPHLHFEIWKDGIPVDPMDYINVSM